MQPGKGTLSTASSRSLSTGPKSVTGLLRDQCPAILPKAFISLTVSTSYIVSYAALLFQHLSLSLLLSALHLLKIDNFAVDVHTGYRLHSCGRRPCPNPHAHSTSPKPLLRCVTASHYLQGRRHTTLRAKRYILVRRRTTMTL